MGLIITKWKNTLATIKQKYVYKSKTQDLITRDQFIDAMEQAGTSVTRIDAVACYELMEKVASDLISKGYRVQLPLVELYLAASGTTDNPDEHFNPSYKTNNHKITVHSKVDKEKAKLIVQNAQYSQQKNNQLGE